MGELAQALQSVVKNKRSNAKQKQRKILQDVQSTINEKGQMIHAQVRHDVQQCMKACQAGFESLFESLEEVVGRAEEARKRYQSDMQGCGEQYKEIQRRAAQLNLGLQATMTKKRSALKRKLDELQREAGDMLSVAKKKISKSRRHATKLPELAKILKAFL
ncbi:unnamed protein product [Ostreobium quekettii]|uniref:Uncharacterized protein n=1 Tax=Ostreobium quekettii TaxID=121088 RepID=A0A8S1J1B5_9CHLO|nr:unnamed protein product [Ostreobium quekettii]